MIYSLVRAIRDVVITPATARVVIRFNETSRSGRRRGRHVGFLRSAVMALGELDRDRPVEAVRLSPMELVNGVLSLVTLVVAEETDAFRQPYQRNSWKLSILL